MEKDILSIMSLAGCTEDMARKAYHEKNEDVILAVDLLIFGHTSPPEIRKRKRDDINEHEEYLNNMRQTMEAIDGNIAEHRSTTSNPLGCAEPDEMQIPLEETVQQSNYLPEYPQSSRVVMGQTQGTAYPLPPEYSCDSL